MLRKLFYEGPSDAAQAQGRRDLFVSCGFQTELHEDNSGRTLTWMEACKLLYDWQTEPVVLFLHLTQARDSIERLKELPEALRNNSAIVYYSGAGIRPEDATHILNAGRNQACRIFIHRPVFRSDDTETSAGLRVFIQRLEYQIAVHGDLGDISLSADEYGWPAIADSLHRQLAFGILYGLLPEIRQQSADLEMCSGLIRQLSNLLKHTGYETEAITDCWQQLLSAVNVSRQFPSSPKAATSVRIGISNLRDQLFDTVVPYLELAWSDRKNEVAVEGNR